MTTARPAASAKSRPSDTLPLQINHFKTLAMSSAMQVVMRSIPDGDVGSKVSHELVRKRSTSSKHAAAFRYRSMYCMRMPQPKATVAMERKGLPADGEEDGALVGPVRQLGTKVLCRLLHTEGNDFEAWRTAVLYK